MAEKPNQIGRGLLFPLRRGPSDFESGTGETLLKSNVRKVVATRAAGFSGKLHGEYPWRKNFGSWIHLLRHSNLTQIRADFAIVYLSMALGRWEPRVEAMTDKSFAQRDPGSSRTQRIRLYFRASGQVSPNVFQPTAAPYQEVTL